MIKQSYSILFSNPSSAKAAHAALALEMGQAHERKATSKVQVKKNRVTFTSMGKDAQAIKASKSTYTQLGNYLKTLEGAR